jgi:folate-binding protein YgfZ
MDMERLRAEGGWFRIKDKVRFAVTGGDRLRYLNGQISNDLRKLSPGNAMQACILSAKGKLDGVVWVWSEGDRYIVEAEASLAEALAMRLERYVVADDVEISALPPGDTVHLFGPAVEAAAALVGARRISRLGMPGVDIPSGEHIPGSLREVTDDEVEQLRIEQRVPRWGAELTPDTLPAEAGLDATAVDFHKGCYIGQEVVSRIRSVGHANRALRIFDVLGNCRPAPGDEFFAAGELGRPAATITSVHFTLSSGVGLCYIRRGTAEGAVLEAPSGGSRIQLRPCVTSS